MAKIYLDAGHGGNDSGAVGNGIKECDINLSVAKRVEYHLIRHAVSTKMSRSTDKTVSLDQRTNEANSWGADILVSIHCNGFNTTAYGVETFCYNFKYRNLADKIHGRIIANKTLYNANRGVKAADFHMLRESNMNAALVEMAFIDNTYDSTLLKTKQEEFAIAITKGILDYFNITWKDEVVQKPTITKGVTYRVVVGSYEDKTNAEKQVVKLKEKGFDSFIAAYIK